MRWPSGRASGRSRRADAYFSRNVTTPVLQLSTSAPVASTTDAATFHVPKTLRASIEPPTTCVTFIVRPSPRSELGVIVPPKAPFAAIGPCRAAVPQIQAPERHCADHGINIAL